MASTSHSYEIGASALYENNDSDDSDDVEFEPSSFIGIPQFERNHERLTALALQCLVDANEGRHSIEVFPSHCLSYYSKDKKITVFNSHEDSEQIQVIDKYKALISYVRWPDDPTRFIHYSKRSSGKFASLIKGGCARLKEKSGGTSESFLIFNNGLFCVSHFGKLQFLHAQASEDGESAVQTRHLIDQWGEFAFELATSSTLWKDDYCDHWNSFEKKPGLLNLGDVMYEGSMGKEGHCDPKKNWMYPIRGLIGMFSDGPITEYYEPWKVGITFNWSCTDPVHSKTCGPYVRFNDQEKKIEAIQLSALGSIIHQIQDSYSKSHTERDSESKGRQPEIVLDRVLSYRSYSNQNSSKHGESDKWPALINKGKTLDPIAATAKIIWLHINHSKSDVVGNTDILSVLNEVLGPQTGSDETASAGKQYSKGNPNAAL